jgi:diguanylate cyclase (GGDEF)-like protein
MSSRGVGRQSDMSFGRDAARPGSNAVGGAKLDARGIIESIGETVYQWDIATDRIDWSDNACDVLRIESAIDIATGRGYAARIAAASPASRYGVVHDSVGIDSGEGVPFQVVYGLDGPDGAVMWVEDTGRWFADAGGRPVRVHGVVRVVTDRYEQTRKLAAAAKQDALTGALNRDAILDHITNLLSGAARKRTSFAILLVAIENLTEVNRTHGYDASDAMIAGVVHRLRTYLRSIDSIARYSGNKTAVLLDSCDGPRMESAARRLLREVGDIEIRTPAGLVRPLLRAGGTVEPQLVRDPRVLLTRAEEALDLARQDPSRPFVAYDSSLARDNLKIRTIQVTNDIVAALNDRRVFLEFQPIIRSGDGIPAFYEALVRVRQGDGSVALPGALLPVAERVGLIQLIDQRVLELAVQSLADDAALTLAINVSPLTVADPDWAARVARALASQPGTAARLIIEITETRAIQDIEVTSQGIADLKALGVRVAMDDFGAGHTSFMLLRKLDVDILKIDGAFIKNLASSKDDRFFVQTLIKLAENVGIPVVAEWVEDVESARILTGWGVPYLQGAYFGNAAPLRHGVAPPRLAVDGRC